MKAKDLILNHYYKLIEYYNGKFYEWNFKFLSLNSDGYDHELHVFGFSKENELVKKLYVDNNVSNLTEILIDEYYSFFHDKHPDKISYNRKKKINILLNEI